MAGNNSAKTNTTINLLIFSIMDEEAYNNQFTSIIWKPVASPDFIADVIVTKYSWPTVRNEKLKLVGGHPTFIVLKSKEVCRGFDGGTPSRKAQVSTFEMVLMDGSFTCFVARLNSGIVHKLNGDELIPGSNITVLSHDFIWLIHDMDPLVRRVVMFIKAFEWEHPPNIHQLEPVKEEYKEALKSESWRCDEFYKDRFMKSAIEACMSRKRILPLNYCMEPDCLWHWDLLDIEGLRKGYWIQQLESKRMWKNHLVQEKKRSAREMASVSDEDDCECVSMFDLNGCVLELYPVCKVCRVDVYDQVYERLGGSVQGDNFDELKPNHKRWSMYWFYSVNILGVTGKRRQKLPNCLVKYIRDLYPNPVGTTFTGFSE